MNVCHSGRGRGEGGIVNITLVLINGLWHTQQTKVTSSCKFFSLVCLLLPISPYTSTTPHPIWGREREEMGAGKRAKYWGGERGGEREKETDRQTDRQRQRDRNRDRDRDRQTDWQRQRDRNRDRNKQTDRQTETDKQTETDRKTDRQTGRDRQKDRQTENGWRKTWGTERENWVGNIGGGVVGGGGERVRERNGRRGKNGVKEQETCHEARSFRYLSQSTPAVSFLHLSFDVHANRSCS